jgi:hypothetical protein
VVNLAKIFVFPVFLFFLIRYFSHLHFQCYPKGLPYPPPQSPTHPLPLFSPGVPLYWGIKFASPMGLSLQWWPTRPSFDTYAARDKSSGVLGSSYCCSTYRVAVPFSSLGTFSSSSIGGRVTHPIADCDHPLLWFAHSDAIQSRGAHLCIYWEFHYTYHLHTGISVPPPSLHSNPWSSLLLLQIYSLVFIIIIIMFV